MASGAFFDPKTALLLTPLVTTSWSFWYSMDQEYFLRTFTLPESRKRSNAILPSYYTNFFYRGIWSVLGLLTATTATSITAIYTARPLLEKRGSVPWYIATASLAVAHLLYAPLITGPVKELVEGAEKDGDANVQTLERWLSVNLVRTWTVDVGALVCCVIAVGKTFSGQGQ